MFVVKWITLLLPNNLGRVIWKAQSFLNIFLRIWKFSFVVLSEEISWSDAGSYPSILALTYHLGTFVNPLVLISPSPLCDTHSTIIPLCEALREPNTITTFHLHLRNPYVFKSVFNRNKNMQIHIICFLISRILLMWIVTIVWIAGWFSFP